MYVVYVTVITCACRCDSIKKLDHDDDDDVLWISGSEKPVLLPRIISLLECYTRTVTGFFPHFVHCFSYWLQFVNGFIKRVWEQRWWYDGTFKRLS